MAERTATEERLVKLADELQKVLTENLLLDHALAGKAMGRAREIREEIESHGWLATWNAGVDVQNVENFSVNVTLWKPRSDLSPENQALYDKWFSGRTRIKSESAEEPQETKDQKILKGLGIKS